MLMLIDHSDEIDDNVDSVHDNEADNENESFNIDTYDPKYCDALDSKMIDTLVINGPRTNLLIEKGPKDKFGRRFITCYSRVLSNGESVLEIGLFI